VIWVTWRLQRIETVLIAAALALAAATLVPLGLHIASVYNDSGVAACLVHAGSGCGGTIDSFRQRFEHAGAIIPWLNFLPGLIGVLFAAPLILEFEHGTFRFAWTQGVPRNRWLAVRLAVAVGGALLAAFALTELMTWYRGPLDHVSGRMEPNVFDFEGIVPYAYTAFALALVLAIGVIARRALTAGAVGLVLYFALRIGLQNWVRKDYVAALRRVWPAGTPGPRNLDRAWSLVSGASDAAGRPLPDRVANAAFTLCNQGGKGRELVACMHARHIYNLAVYQPAGRFWLFQGIEAAIFAGLALLLFAAAAVWVRRRIS
jgi:hypothetical protein